MAPPLAAGRRRRGRFSPLLGAAAAAAAAALAQRSRARGLTWSVARAARPQGIAVLDGQHLRSRLAAPERRSTSAAPRAPPKEKDEWTSVQGTYCINLDHRQDRWAYMCQQFERLRLPVQRRRAVDGTRVDVFSLLAEGTLSAEAIQRLSLPDEEKAFGIDLTRGAIGCALSHIELWREILSEYEKGDGSDQERDAIYLVMEDDCKFLPDFSARLLEERLAEVPADWQMIFLGGVDALGAQHLLQVSPGVRRVYHGSRETTAYLVNIAGIRAALDVCVPLTWQLDTALTRTVRLISESPPLAYTTSPTGYLLWPPLVEQDKISFATDVQKDEHPLFLPGGLADSREANRTQAVQPAAWGLPPEDVGPSCSRRRRTEQQRGAVAAPRAALPPKGSYALIGSWDGWSSLLHLRRDRLRGGFVFVTEVQVPLGDDVHFQIVPEANWGQRIFPHQEGGIAFGSGQLAHGKNWHLPSPPSGGLNNLHVQWEPQREPAPRLQYSFGESSSVAFSKTYALIGSWDGWSSPVAFKPMSSNVAFTAEVRVHAGDDVYFQIICDDDRDKRIYPLPGGRHILGPGTGGHGHNWRVPAPSSGESLLQVLWNPLGQQAVLCCVAEAAEAALARTYSLCGSWSDWSSLDELAREDPDDSECSTFVREVQVPAGKDIVFQVLCDGDYCSRMFPRDGHIVGPCNSNSGSDDNWRLPAPAHPGVLHMRWNPTGRRSMSCRLVLEQEDEEGRGDSEVDEEEVKMSKRKTC